MTGLFGFHPSKLLLFASLSFLAGVAFAGFSDWDPGVGSLAVLASFAAVAGAFWSRPRVFAFFFFAVCCIVGMWRYDIALQPFLSPPLVGREIEATGFVFETKESSGDSKRITVELDGCENSLGCMKDRVSVLSASWRDFAYGDRVRVVCVLDDPVNSRGGKEWKMYLAVSDVKYQCVRGSLTRVLGVSGSGVIRGLDALKRTLVSNVNRSLPQPHAALGSSLLFGGMGDLSQEVRADFSRTSMTHITAVSGYNISILVVFLTIVGIALGLSRRCAVFASFLGIIAFVAMIGFQASAVRAAFMGSTVLFATMIGRGSSANLALVYAAAVMVAYQPLLLRWDIGFQLSFLATFGILALIPIVTDRFSERGGLSVLRDIIAVSCAAQLFVAPIIAYHFHTVSFIGILANFFILWIIPFTMAGIGLVSVSAFIGPFLSTPFSWLTYGLLEYELSAIRFFAGLPFGAVEGVNPSGWIIVALYVSLLVITGILRRNRKLRCPARAVPTEAT